MDEWVAPAPGPWTLDQAHSPHPQTPIVAELMIPGFNRGFSETFGRYGLLLDRLAIAGVNGFTYHQPQPFDMPGPDGPKSPEEIGAEFGRRVALAEETFETKRWRADLEMWDTECKPEAIARHRELGAVDLDTLDDTGLQAHIADVAEHLNAMVYQHHRFNMAALLPVGDLALHVAGWAHVPPTVALGVLDGYSPVSSVASSEMSEALAALRADDGAQALLTTDGDAGDRLARLRAAVPAVDDSVTVVQDRPIDGFDIVSPTLRELPELVLGKLTAALASHPEVTRERADALAAELRDQVPAQHRAEFDELVGEARAVYRLRDERGLFSDITAIGLMRRALLAVGRRLVERGQLTDPEQVLDSTLTEVGELLAGGGPSADELTGRADERRRKAEQGAPRYLGDPPQPPPPVDGLPPALARLMSSVGFMIDAVLGQMDAPGGEGGVIRGIGVGDKVAEGRARLVRDIDDLLSIEEGDVIVASTTGEAFNAVLHLVEGIVTDHGSHACHAAIVAREMGFPAIVGTVDGTRRIKDGDRVRLDGSKGEILVLA
jgi:phosphohistidine swiveling domain-containing protein